jgi:HemK-related putative methylase
VFEMSEAQLIPRLQELPGPVRLNCFARLMDRALTLFYALSGKRRYDAFRLEQVRGARFIVIPTVFNPKLPRTGEFLASVVDGPPIADDADVLDMGTGSGVCAVLAARHARRIVAVDINPEAVRCARINALLNHVEHKIDVRCGDLFAPVAEERFDLVLFNPPFLQGTPRDHRDSAWRSSDVADRFAAGLSAHLKPGGCALVLLSTFGDARAFLEQFHRQRLGVQLHAERRFINERLMIFRLTPLYPIGGSAHA